MATEKKSNTLAQIGPVAAPLAGVVIAIALIAAAFLTSSVSDSSDALTTAVANTRKSLESTAVTPVPGGEIPLADNVASSFARAGTNDWKADAGNRKLLALPVKWEVTMDTPKGDWFVQADENQDGLIDAQEFSRNMPDPWPGTLKAKFENWDRLNENGEPKPDGFIDRKEYEDPPTSPEETFAAMQKDEETDFLTSKAGEITSDEEFKWDRYPFDGKINFEEYRDRYKPHDERGLGAVTDVKATVDTATMEIVVSWSDPKIDDKPEDIAFMILRSAPETREKRQKEYGRKVGEYEKKLREWEDAFSRWWNDATADAGGKTNKQKWPKKADAEREYAKTNARPVPPEIVSDWERVTSAPVTGNEYRDKSFDMDVTYTYAVYMGTQKKPKREQKVRPGTEANFPDWFFYAEDTVATGHPVRVRNRIEMAYAGASSETVNILLTKWYKQEEPAAWYRIQIKETVPLGEAIGGLYKMADLRSRDLKLRDVAGTELNPQELLPADVTVDFTTGFSFIQRKKGAQLNSRTLGDFVLPVETNQPPKVPQGTAGTDDALEVRCLTIKEDGKEATFELTRWTKVGETWLRVVMTSTAKKGAAVGGEVDLSKTGADVVVWDATGKELKAADLKAFSDAKVDLVAGTFDGFVDRTVTVGGAEFDLFGTLYKD